MEEQVDANVPEFNAWLTATRSTLSKYSDGQKIEAVNYLYSDVYVEIDEKVKSAKSRVSLLETTFEKMKWKVTK